MRKEGPAATRRISLAAGVLFLGTFITGIPALLLFQPVLDDPAGYIAGAGADNRIFLGAALELLLIVANIGTAVVLFPVLRRRSEILSLGYVTARIVECTFIAAGILCVLGIVSLRADDPSAASLAVSLASIKDWTFLLGPGLIVGIGNGVILATLAYRSELVPRSLAMLGLVGGPLIVASGIGVLFGLIEPGGAVQGVATVPEFAWELVLGVYLTVRGFKRAPGARDTAGLAVEPLPAA